MSLLLMHAGAVCAQLHAGVLGRMFYADTLASLGHVRAFGACQGLHPSEPQRRVFCQHARQARLTTQDTEVHSNTRRDANGSEMWQLLWHTST